MNLSEAIRTATAQHQRTGEAVSLVRDLDSLEFKIGDTDDFDYGDHVELLGKVEENVWHGYTGFINQTLRNMGFKTTLHQLSEV